jgi:hypothetical protein
MPNAQPRKVGSSSAAASPLTRNLHTVQAASHIMEKINKISSSRVTFFLFCPFMYVRGEAISLISSDGLTVCSASP